MRFLCFLGELLGSIFGLNNFTVLARTLFIRAKPTGSGSSPATPRIKKGGPQYRSLLSYGQQVFQFCVASVLFGAELAEKAGLAEKLVTNQERFTEVCKIFNEKSSSAVEKFQRIEPLVAAAERFKHINESGLKIET